MVTSLVEQVKVKLAQAQLAAAAQAERAAAEQARYAQEAARSPLQAQAPSQEASVPAYDGSGVAPSVLTTISVGGVVAAAVPIAEDVTPIPIDSILGPSPSPSPRLSDQIIDGLVTPLAFALLAMGALLVTEEAAKAVSEVALPTALLLGACP